MPQPLRRVDHPVQGDQSSAHSEYNSKPAMRMTTMAKNSKNPIPMSVYVNRSYFMDGLRAMPTTSAAKSWPMPWAQPPTATIAMAQPSTDTQALRVLRGSPKPVGFADAGLVS